MSRFVNIQVPRWATGNYTDPGKPWDGLSKQTVPAFDGFTPDTTYAAEHMNSVIDSRLAKLAIIATGLQAAVGDLQATPMRSVALNNANENFREVKYLTANVGGTYNGFAWFVLSRNTSTGYSYLYVSRDAGTTFSLVFDGAATDPTSIGNVTAYDQRMCPLAISATVGGSGYTIIFSHGVTAGKVRYLQAGTWAEITHGEGTLNANGFSSMIQRFGGAGNDGGIFIGYSAATKATFCSAALAFTSMTASIPAALNTDQLFCGRSDRTGKVVVFSKTAARSTYMYVNAGSTTWNSATSPVGAGESAVSVCHDGTFWYLLTNVSGNSKIYQSSTGTGSWTLVRTVSGMTLTSFDCDVGGTMMATAYNGSGVYGNTLVTTALDPSIYSTNGAVLASGQTFSPMVGTEMPGGSDTQFHEVVCAKSPASASQLSQFAQFTRSTCKFGVPMGLGSFTFL